MDDWDETLLPQSPRWHWMLVNTGSYITSKRGTGTYSGKIFLCPSMKNVEPFGYTGTSTYYGSVVSTYTNYGMNTPLFGLKLSVIKNPHDKTAFITEILTAAGTSSYRFAYYPENHYLPTIDTAPHNKGINMLWLDGHVSWMPLPAPEWSEDPVFWYTRTY